MFYVDSNNQEGIRLTEDEFQKWIEALESGKYLQGTNYLKAEVRDGVHKYCCLGVLGEVCNLPNEEAEMVDQHTMVFEFVGENNDRELFHGSSLIWVDHAEFLSTRNDGTIDPTNNPSGEKWNFLQIASWLKEHKSDYVVPEGPLPATYFKVETE